MGIGSQINKQSRLASIATFYKIEAAVISCVKEEEAEEDGRFTDRYSAGEADSFVYDLSLPGESQGLVRKGSCDKIVMPSVIFANLESRSGSRSGSSVGGGGCDESLTVMEKKKKGAIRRIREWNSERSIRKSKRERQKNKIKNSRGGIRKRFMTDT